ncbi:hypothetical protein GGR58DRAFT_497675 [Xylaria digitata]|nr:hypothetical protein GGR58DRAFT_497675 [Xylaria digitata]
MIANHGNVAGASISAQKYRHSNYPHCSVEDIIRQNWPQKSKKQRDKGKLPGMDRGLRDLEDRDQCFIIDNSSSMMNYWDEVKRITLALASIVQDIEPDDFELFCTNTNNPMKTKNCKGLEEWLNENQPYNGIGPSRMENHLDIILPELVTKATKPRNLWDRNDDSDTTEAAGQSIKTIVNKVKEQDRPRTFLPIQFVRFGENSVGKKRLQWLDGDLKHFIPDQWDIVDTTPHTGSVWKMLIGATSALEDNIVEGAEQTDAFTSQSIQRG